jgi:hypothetical protein
VLGKKFEEKPGRFKGQRTKSTSATCIYIRPSPPGLTQKRVHHAGFDYEDGGKMKIRNVGNISTSTLCKYLRMNLGLRPITIPRAAAKIKISCLRWESNSDFSVVQPVV